MKKFFTFLLTSGGKGAKILIAVKKERLTTLRNSESAEKQAGFFVEKNGAKKIRDKTSK